MVLFKQLRDFQSCIISNGKTYLFNQAGTCFKEDAGLIPEYTTGMISVNIISVIRSGGYSELGIAFEGGNFKKYKLNRDATDVILQLQVARGYTHILNRRGNQKGVSFSQAFFVYPQGTDMNGILKILDLSEVTY